MHTRHFVYRSVSKASVMWIHCCYYPREEELCELASLTSWKKAVSSSSVSWSDKGLEPIFTYCSLTFSIVKSSGLQISSLAFARLSLMCFACGDSEVSPSRSAVDSYGTIAVAVEPSVCSSPARGSGASGFSSGLSSASGSCGSVGGLSCSLARLRLSFSALVKW